MLPNPPDFAPPALQAVDLGEEFPATPTVQILRLDQLHPELGGNKWFKLQLNLRRLFQTNTRLVVSFGGAWSNHLRALAAAGEAFGFHTVGVIRGELPRPLNPVLAFARRRGMQLYPVTRAEYRDKDGECMRQRLQREFGDHYLLPEGGSNSLGYEGCKDIASLLPPERPGCKRLIALPVGTGCTMAGLVAGLHETGAVRTRVAGVKVLRADGYPETEIRSTLESEGLGHLDTWQVFDSHHGGGYARVPTELSQFIGRFNASQPFVIEPVYSGKLLWWLADFIGSNQAGEFDELICLHTGGVYQDKT